ncbi:glycosyltransferase family 4 protein [Spirosoma arcticum]
MTKPPILRIIILNSHPIQYFAPLYRKLATDTNVDLTVYYASRHGLDGGIDRQFGTRVQWDVPLLAGYQTEFLRNYALRPSIYSFFGLLNLGIVGRLWQAPSSVLIIHGWAYAVNWMALLFGALFGHTVCVRCDTAYFRELTDAHLAAPVRDYMLRHIFFKLVDYCFYAGQGNRAFYTYFGVAEEKLIFLPFAVDTERFHAEKAALNGSRQDILKRMRIDGAKRIILFCGKFTPVKRPLDLLMAYRKLNRRDVALVMIGEGELRTAMEQYIDDYQLPDVYLTGFVNQSEIGAYYSVANLYVMCSDGDAWGLSVNEAMLFGLPIVLSDRVGCAPDLLINNGLQYPCGNVDELTRVIQRLLTLSAAQFSKLGTRSADIISRYTYDRTISTLKQTFLHREAGNSSFNSRKP